MRIIGEPDRSPQPNAGSGALLAYRWRFWVVVLVTGVGAGLGAGLLMKLLHGGALNEALWFHAGHLPPFRTLLNAGDLDPVSGHYGAHGRFDKRHPRTGSCKMFTDRHYEGTLHGEDPVWEPARERLLWSDVPNRRLLAWQLDGAVTVAIGST